jgi:hypothetical protein
MRQFYRNQMKRNGIPFGRGYNKIVKSYVKDGKLYTLHATKGWRKQRILTDDVL